MIAGAPGAAERPAGAVPRAVRVLADMPLPDRSGPYRVEVERFEPHPAGAAAKLRAALGLYRKGLTRDAVFFNQPAGLLFAFLALRALLPIGRARVVVFDIILPKPGRSAGGRLSAALKRSLLRRVDLFILHVKEPGGLEAYYGVPRAKSVFVPFKVNGLEELGRVDATDRGYILAPGRSWRDYPTFCAAMARVPHPAKILMPRAAGEGEAHGMVGLGGAALPPNVEVVHDDGTPESWARFLGGARVVALPISPESISAAGNSTYIQAMALGKPVVITDCPGARGILEDGRTALIVPQGDPEAMAAALRRAWEDGPLRRRLAEEGRAYALSLGGEDRLLADLLRETVAELGRAGRLPGAAAPGSGPA